MATIIRMPSVLAGSEEAAIASWLVTPGQTVAVGDPLAEIETEKAVVEYNSEDAGVVGRVLLEPGEAGEIGAPIAVLISEGETDADIDAALGQAPAAAVTGPDSAPDATERDPDGGTPVVEAASLEAAAEEAAPEVPEVPELAAEPSPAESADDRSRLFVSPIARKLAKERGLDPATITGTGPGGRIVRRDVEDAVVPAGAPSAAVPATAAPAAASAPAA